MRDLLAIAAVRRMLLELGVNDLTLVDEGEVGTLEVWTNTPSQSIGMATPLALMDNPNGAAAVRELLQQLLDRRRPLDRP